MSTARARYVVEAVLSGMAHGMRQPSLVVRLVLPAAAVKALDRLAQGAGPAPRPRQGRSAVEAVDAADRLAAWVVALQDRAGLAVFGPPALIRNQQDGDGGCFALIAIPYPPAAPNVPERVLRWALERLADADGDLLPRVQELMADLHSRAALEHNTPRFLAAAYAAGIPWDTVAGTSLQFGWGARSCLLESSFTGRTSLLGVRWARAKPLASQVLRRAGLPAPRHALARTLQQALRIAAEIGYPVVAKPADTDGGVGVAPGLRDEHMLSRAFGRVQAHGRPVLIEAHVPGEHYRLLVFGGRHIWTNHLRPGAVVGDGRSTLAELVQRLNDDPRRGSGPQAELKPLVWDDEAAELAAEQGLEAGGVPGRGQQVRLRWASNMARGGSLAAVNERVHADNSQLAEQVAAAFGLDLVGIDLLMPDISQSWLEVGGAICDVNAQPGFADSTQRHLHGAILQALVSGNGRIPVAVLVACEGDPVVARLRASLVGRGRRIDFCRRPWRLGGRSSPRRRPARVVRSCAQPARLQGGRGLDPAGGRPRPHAHGLARRPLRRLGSLVDARGSRSRQRQWSAGPAGRPCRQPAVGARRSRTQPCRAARSTPARPMDRDAQRHLLRIVEETLLDEGG